MRFLLLSLALLAALPTPASACGGPERAVLDAPLRPARHYLDSWLYGSDGYDTYAAPVTRVLYGAHAMDPAVYAALEANLYGAPLADAPPLVAPTGAGFEAALAAGDRTRARAEAMALVEAILDLPAPLAEPHAHLLKLPVEYLELEPKLGGLPAPTIAAYFRSGAASGPVLTQAVGVRGLAPADAAAVLARSPNHPRAASLRWLSLRAAMKRDIPDGWDREEIRTAMGTAVPARLRADADAWLRDFPGHPLADYVRLEKLRVHYLAGEDAAAWALLFEMYARHPARVVNEMRFLLAQDVTLPPFDPLALPPELASTLLDSAVLGPEEWTALWKKTEAGGPWALPLQERLLWQLALKAPGAALPPGFPTTADAPSPTWARLRLVVLLRERRLDEAWAQTERMKADPDFIAPIRAQIQLLRGDWVGAIREPGLDPDSRSYLVRVLAPDEVLRALIAGPTGDPDALALVDEARLELALRARATKGWTAGMKLLGRDPSRVAQWKEARRLARKDPVAYARYLRKQGGEIFISNTYYDVIWYRSLPSGPETPERPPGLPFAAADEWGATTAWLTRSFATYVAFQAYAEWLGELDVSRLSAGERLEARKVLREADTAYNLLLNYGSSEYYAWGDILPESPEAVTVRRVGRALNE